MLKINATGGLPTIPINTKRTPHIGDVVLAIGNPYNLGQTITRGIISATGRIGLNPTGRQNFLQTDASINHGNSGGALVNSLGELMGINTLSFDKSNDGETPEGLGFAIPFQLATKIMDKLIRDGRVIRGYIGIGGREIAPLHAQQGSGMDPIQGIVVNEVTPNGPAALAGIQVNDLIISVNNKPAVSALETMDQVAEIRPGSVIPVVVMRDDKQLTFGDGAGIPGVELKRRGFARVVRRLVNKDWPCRKMRRKLVKISRAGRLFSPTASSRSALSSANKPDSPPSPRMPPIQSSRCAC